MGTPRDGSSVPVTGWALLGLLSSGREMTGYDLKKWADHSLRFFHLSPALSQVYAELRRLESLGYVEHRVAPVENDDLRSKRLYTLTGSGREAVTAWLRESDVEPGVLKHPVILRIWLGHLTGPERIAQLIEEHQASTRALVEEIRATREAAPRGADNAYATAILAWAERHYTGEVDAFDELRASLAAVRRAPAPLAPEAVELVRRLEASFPALESLSPVEGRAQLSATTRARKSTDLPATVEEIRMPGPGGELAARVYRPSSPGPHPVVVYFHGGGFCVGDLDMYDAGCAALCAGTDAAVVSVDYRLAPEHPFPAAVDDAYASTVWVAEHGAELGLDATRLAVAGDSAGANLATVTATLARDLEGPEIAFQLLLFPPTDLAARTASHDAYGHGGYYMRQETSEWFLAQYLPDRDDAHDPRASPLRTPDLAGLPAAHVAVGECDALVDECLAYGDRLRKAGSPAEVRVYAGMFHGFFNMPLKGAGQAREEAYAAVRRALGT